MFNKVKNKRIQFTTRPTSLGVLLIAGTSDGLCSVRLGNHAGQLENEFLVEFSEAHIQPGNADVFNEWVETVLRYIDNPAREMNIPLDVRGTSFQNRVWQTLREIPVGETASYGQVAQRIGQPTAVRAVARACASNPLALVIPCHRVIGASGNLTGYRWGIERKKRLLENEKPR